MDIASGVRRCLDTFQSLLDKDTPFSDENTKTRLANEASRFKIWTGNLSAHRPSGRRSLEYRLRDSQNLRKKVLDLLEDLTGALERLQNSESESDEEHESDDDLLDFEYDDLATQSSDALQDVHDIITLMYHFSIALRNPAGHSRIKEGFTSSANFYTPYDLEHVKNKYPQAQQYLVERLAKAISSRRQYCRYREDHHAKLNAGLDDEGVDEMPSTIATSQHSGKIQFTTLEDDEVASVNSFNSFAPTESETGNLRPPPLPEAGHDGEPFECPICFGMQVFANEQSWHKHVFEDAPPYLCTIEACDTPNRQYSRRKEWQMHCTTAHHSTYVCPFGCGKSYDSATRLESHLIQGHNDKLDEQNLHRMSKNAAKTSGGRQDLHCPLCQKESSTINLHFRHIGKHLEQLAFYSLPSHIFAADSDGEGDSDETSGGSFVNLTKDGEPEEPADEIVEVVENHSSDDDNSGPKLRKGKTRMPLRLVRAEVLVQLGYNFEREGEFFIVRNALSKEQIDEVIRTSDQGSKPHQEKDERGNLTESMIREMNEKERERITPPEAYAAFLRDMAETQEKQAPEEHETEEQMRERFANFSYDTVEEHRGNQLDEEERKRIIEEYERKQRAEKWEREEKEEEYQAFLHDQQIREERKKREEVEAEQKLQAAMRKRLANLGYTEQTIDIMVDEEKAKAFKEKVENRGERFQPWDQHRAPVYPKVHREYLDIETLRYYDLPWEYDRTNPDYIIILRDMEKRETDVLFEHTARLRAGRLIIPGQKGPRPSSSKNQEDRFGSSNATGKTTASRPRARSQGHSPLPQTRSQGPKRYQPLTKSPVNRSPAPPSPQGPVVTELSTCNYCSKDFETQDELNSHLRSHSEYMDRQHVCPHCKYRFTHSKDLNRHLATHADPAERKVYCPFPKCEWHTRGFTKEENLQSHMASRHSDA